MLSSSTRSKSSTRKGFPSHPANPCCGITQMSELGLKPHDSRSCGGAGVWKWGAVPSSLPVQHTSHQGACPQEPIPPPHPPLPLRTHRDTSVPGFLKGIRRHRHKGGPELRPSPLRLLQHLNSILGESGEGAGVWGPSTF